MSESDRKNFLLWYNAQSGPFDFQREATFYCRYILASRQQLNWLHYSSVAASRLFQQRRRYSVQADGQVQRDYSGRIQRRRRLSRRLVPYARFPVFDNIQEHFYEGGKYWRLSSSKLFLGLSTMVGYKFLSWLNNSRRERDLPLISHAGTEGGEVKVAGYKVDGYEPES